MAQSEKPSPSSPGIPLRTRIALHVITAVTNASRRQNGTVNRRLLSVFNLKCRPNPKPVNGVSSSDVTVDPSRNLWFRLFTPTDESVSIPIIVFFHGGGFVFHGPDTTPYDAVCRRLARELTAVVVSINYRLAPENRYPAQYEDGVDVVKFLEDEKNRGILPENVNLEWCFLAGDSAGGNLAHHVAKRVAESQSSFVKLTVNGLIAIQPFFGGEERTDAETRLAKIDPMLSMSKTDWMWKAFLPEGDGMDRDHEVINVSGPRAADISMLQIPPTLVVVAGFDSLQDWQRRYYHWLIKSGKEATLTEYPTMVHGFYVFPELPESTQLISEIKDFVHDQCSKN